ncbi:DUF4238 domain-containing protein [Methylobacterium fujisawaense]|uniref:DUF4238 domain-containing protein n=1 Tax=Methylobacterium fujisawaense TaxID=107400 RepID=UPI00244852D1|nr:DUF4238 domain-containing protein [Methylobacterium fujisawaense]MDH3031448.1 DUF4238 domain-containing protein [Methylobacterium fujisawaense]
MSITRDNHYVPIWYQRGFLESGSNQLAYRDLTPEEHRLPDGSTRIGRSRFKSSPKQCFVQTDLYTTFFGPVVNDEIERRLFGAIDTDGAPAIKAFISEDVSAWHHHFQTLFRFIDIQKLRTPKGLDWLRGRYPKLSQNELMMEMQSIQTMHCTIWSESVREIVSAAASDVKFIISDHPVTVYNYAMPPEAEGCRYPLDPPITLKASQTVYPLDRDHCLILTNLEYAQDPETPPLVKRTFSRNFRTSMVRTDAFCRLRQLHTDEVRQINRIIKARARRFIAAGREEWLDPEIGDDASWSELRGVLQPPKPALFGFGGELFARFEDGRVHYQDSFGRTEKSAEFLKKKATQKNLSRAGACGCGSGMSYESCCRPLPPKLRPSWSERGIRERNLMLYRGIETILGLDQGRDWLEIRRSITDEHIRDVHSLYRSLWPIETDILQLLPKPDGRPRAVYTGLLHPMAITEFAIGSSLYFGELIIEHPFLHAANIQPDMSPIENPHLYHHDFIKTLYMFLTLRPLVESGHVNLIPDPAAFDLHLNEQMFHMARKRSAMMKVSVDAEPRMMRLLEQDMRRSLMSIPPEGLRAQLRRSSPELDSEGIEEAVRGIRRQRELDPLASVQDGLLGSGRGGQLSLSRMAPNFEMALYVAQATGASIVTDSPHRWREMRLAAGRQGGRRSMGIPAFAEALAASPVGFANETKGLLTVAATGAFEGYAPLMRDAFNYLVKLEHRGAKPNREAGLSARLAKLHRDSQRQLKKAAVPFSPGRVHGLFPVGGIQDNTVNRLLIMSSSEHHLHNVPMAFFIEPITR